MTRSLSIGLYVCIHQLMIVCIGDQQTLYGRRDNIVTGEQTCPGIGLLSNATWQV